MNVWSYHWLTDATREESEIIGTFYAHWWPTPMLYQIETDDGFSPEDLMQELGRGAPSARQGRGAERGCCRAARSAATTSSKGRQSRGFCRPRRASSSHGAVLRQTWRCSDVVANKRSWFSTPGVTKAQAISQ